MTFNAIARRVGRWLGVGLMMFVGACQTLGSSPPMPQSSQTQIQSGPSLYEKVALRDRWIVSVSEAEALIQQGAMVLDANGRTKNAMSITWQQFSQPRSPHRGKLLKDDAELTQQLQALGISEQKPVLVLGRPQKHWGEEGRIVWMLRSLGHRQAYLVDRGQTSLSVLPSRPTTKGDFQVKRDRRWTVSRDELKAQLNSQNIQMIDSREAREYAGKTPYGETRGGHIPGAMHLYFKEFLTPEGALLPHGALINRLESLGITPNRPVVIYCTGGIRSGWLTSVLVSLGYPAQNYPGSMWDWSASPEADYPLTKL